MVAAKRRGARTCPGPILPIMKLQVELHTGSYAITGYGEGYVSIGGRRHTSSLVVMPDRAPQGWGAAGFAGLAVAEFEFLRGLAPDLVLLGTGTRQRFPAPALLRPLIEARIGYEVMDCGAACRTYNVLMAEGRRVAAALLFD